MSNISLIQNLDTLSKNPIFLSCVIENFYKFSQKKERNILLAYLIVPLTFNDESRKFLCNTKSTSSLFTFCRNKNVINSLQSKVLSQKKLSSKSLHVSFSSKRLKINNDLSIEFRKENEQMKNIYIDEKKAAEKLALLLNPFDIQTIYRILGVKLI